MLQTYETLLCMLSCCFAAGLGFAARYVVAARLRAAAYRRNLGLSLELAARGSHSDQKALGWSDRIFDVAIRRSRGRATGSQRRAWFAKALAPLDLEERCLLAGLDGVVTAEGFAETRLLVALVFSGGGFVLGLLVSSLLAALLAASGFALGLFLPCWALADRRRCRADEAESCLPELLDIISLGMRSGLSFDRALEFYLQYFDNVLATSFSKAFGQYSQGLTTREEALLAVASAYDSPALSQTVGTVVRSLRFGASLVEPLEDTARQVRASYKARKEEEVSKAPVKMMIPTGALILPAMLVLVLGPVMLELTTGF